MVGDSINISASSVCRIIRRVSHFIALLRDNFIAMPEDREINDIKTKFYEIAGFPGIVGAIDCTHIPIQSPGGAEAELYRNRKGYFSLNVQAVCNTELKFLNVVSRWRGSVHDSTIFNASHLRARFETGEFPNAHLLGDNGYACRRYLLTPFLNPRSPAEERYNAVHKTTRNVIEMAFGVLKRRLPCLSMIC